MTWFVYILHCADGSFYVGHTCSVEKRFACHRANAGARHTAMHPPDQVVYKEEFASPVEAVRRERQLKGWRRGKKEALIAGDLDALRQQSHSMRSLRSLAPGGPRGARANELASNGLSLSEGPARSVRSLSGAGK